MSAAVKGPSVISDQTLLSVSQLYTHIFTHSQGKIGAYLSLLFISLPAGITRKTPRTPLSDLQGTNALNEKATR